ncbi:MAG: sigma-54 dependent transcriptional regulator [Deltaproteobacteria bacterium]
MELRILVMDADQRFCERVEENLDTEGWSVSWCTCAEDGLTLAVEQPYDAILIALELADLDGLSVCRRLTASLATPVVVLAADGDMSTAVSALRAGAFDFISKPVQLAELRACIERSVREHYRGEAVHRLERSESGGRRAVGELIGESRAMTNLYDLIRRVAASETTLLLSGESGTGKELVARALHGESGRSQGPLVAINCAAVPENLLESELFGHVKGSFTDAKADRRGMIQQADQGTLLLDEIAELPLALQPKLLRVLQERQVRPVGGDSTVSVRTRILAATNRDLELAVAAGRFRMDLYFRLNVVQLSVPPLRARGSDILLLAEHFLHKGAARLGQQPKDISADAARKLCEYDWPGNVRQLENAIERALTLTRGSQLMLEDLPERIQHTPTNSSSSAEPLDFITLAQREQRHIEYVIRKVKGNKARAARLLGVDRRTLYRKLVQGKEAPGPARASRTG